MSSVCCCVCVSRQGSKVLSDATFHIVNWVLLLECSRLWIWGSRWLGGGGRKIYLQMESRHFSASFAIFNFSMIVF